MFCLESSDENWARRTLCETLHAKLASYHHHRARRLRTDVFFYGWILEASSERSGSSQGVRRCSASQPRLCTSAAYASKECAVAHPRSCRRCCQSGEAGVAHRDEASRYLRQGSFQRASQPPLQAREAVVLETRRQIRCASTAKHPYLRLPPSHARSRFSHMPHATQMKTYANASQKQSFEDQLARGL